MITNLQFTCTVCAAQALPLCSLFGGGTPVGSGYDPSMGMGALPSPLPATALPAIATLMAAIGTFTPSTGSDAGVASAGQRCNLSVLASWLQYS